MHKVPADAGNHSTDFNIIVLTMPIPLVQSNSGPSAQPANPFAAQRAKVEKNLGNVKKAIAVHCGKGGVGKSTFAVNLAVALSKGGKKVGLLDADVDCPSCHALMGMRGRALLDDEQRIVPLSAHNVKFLSAGNMVDDANSANIMRGPIMFKLISDMLSNAAWGGLDYLVIDLPPGTGDNPLTIMQLVPLHGIIIVTQPQEICLTDAKKSANMAKRMGVKVLGVVENMSGSVFGAGGGGSGPRVCSKCRSLEAYRSSQISGNFQTRGYRQCLRTGSCSKGSGA